MDIRVQRLGWEASRKLHDEKSHMWKGDNVTYSGIHAWVKRKLGSPDTCENCGKTGLTGCKIHWANISGEYKRDLSDWIRLCVPCHFRMDKIGLTRKRDSGGRFL